MTEDIVKSYIETQVALQSKINLQNRINIQDIKLVAGVDLAYWKENETEYAVCCIVLDGEIYGRALRTQRDVKPIFLSVGHKVDLETAMGIAAKLVTKDSHIPLPTRLADIMTHKVRKDAARFSDCTG